MVGNDYNIALLIFFVPYILFEIPSNIFIKRLKPSNWLSIIMFIWGIATICQGLCHNFGGLLACRIIIGLAEAGYVHFRDGDNSRFFPGCIYLLSMYYKRWELQQRIVHFYFELPLILGVVLLRFNSRGIIWWSLSLRDRQNGRSRRKTRLGMDLHHRGTLRLTNTSDCLGSGDMCGSYSIQNYGLRFP